MLITVALVLTPVFASRAVADVIDLPKVGPGPTATAMSFWFVER
jgi:hypothetical protein